VRPGFNQLRLTLIVSPAGDVVSADANGDGKILKFWPQLKSEVSEWKFTPFQKDGMAVIAEVDGMGSTVREFLEAGVPLKPLPAPKPNEPGRAVPFDDVGWLNAASSHPEALGILIDAEASKDDQNDKDLALVGAARSGNLEAARALIGMVPIRTPI
jgi:hypothetical protein